MINIKGAKASVLKKIIIAAAVVIVAVGVMNYLPLKESVQVLAFLGENSDSGSPYISVMRKAVPMMDVVMDDGSGKNLSGLTANSILKYLTNIDIENPQTYLASEIPLFGLFEIVTFSGSVGGSSSSPSNNQTVAANTGQTKQPDNVSSVNFDTKPVTGTAINPEKPEVIIFHTHTSESYTPSDKYKYEVQGDFETDDKNYNVCKLGDEIKGYLETYYGVSVLHDTTVHDKPSRNGSYNRAKTTIEKLLKKYPEVKLIIDLHRDAVDDKNLVTTNIRGDQASRLMFVIGKSNPHWQENYYLASKLDQKIEELYPGLSRSKPIYFGTNLIYNQDISNKLMILEIGAQCNSLDESIVSAKMVARSIGQILKEE